MFGKVTIRATVFAAALGLAFGFAGSAQAADTIKIAVPAAFTGSAAGYG